MKYAEARDLMQSGDVYATSHEGLQTREDWEVMGVRAATLSEFSHCGIIVADEGRVWLMEAVVPCVRKIAVSEIQGKFYWIPMRRPLSPEATTFALSLEGMIYSKKEAIFGFFDMNDETDSKTQCAEVVRMVRNRDKKILHGKATPASVVRNCMELDNPLIMVTR